jgi:hypothetical protein
LKPKLFPFHVFASLSRGEKKKIFDWLENECLSPIENKTLKKVSALERQLN